MFYGLTHPLNEYTVETIESKFAIVYEAIDHSKGRTFSVLKSPNPEITGYRLIHVFDSTTRPVWGIVLDSRPFIFTGNQYGIACFVSRAAYIQKAGAVSACVRTLLRNTQAFVVHYLVLPDHTRNKRVRRMKIIERDRLGFMIQDHHRICKCLPVTPHLHFPLTRLNKDTVKRMFELFILHLDVAGSGRAQSEHDQDSEGHDGAQSEHDRETRQHDGTQSEHDREPEGHDRAPSEHDRETRRHDGTQSEHDQESEGHDSAQSEHRQASSFPILESRRRRKRRARSAMMMTELYGTLEESSSLIKSAKTLCPSDHTFIEYSARLRAIPKGLRLMVMQKHLDV